MTMLDLSRISSFDTETPKFSAGYMAPQIVCASTARVVGGQSVGKLHVGKEAARAAFLEAVHRGDLLAMANGPYDLAVLAQEYPDLLPLIFALLDRGLVHDIITSQVLNAIFYGHLGQHPDGGELRKPSTGKVTNRYSLEVIDYLNFGRVDAKANDAWRTSYGLLLGVPEHRWPPLPTIYPVDDACRTLDNAVAQIIGVPGKHEFVDVPGIPGAVGAAGAGVTVCRYCKCELGIDTPPVCSAAPRTPHKNSENLREQVDADFCLKVNAAHGLRTDPEKVEKLAAEVEEKHRRAVERFQKKGWYRENGTEDTAAVKRAVATAYGAKGTCKRCEGGAKCRWCKGTGNDGTGRCKKCDGLGVFIGKIQNIDEVECRGEKARGRYQGCKKSAECVCGGTGVVRKYGSIVICKNEFDETGEVLIAEGCDGTGFDLSTAPMLPRTDKLGVKTERDALMESGDQDLSDFGENEFEKSLSTYVPYLRTGTTGPLYISSNVLVATGRCSYEDCPVHQFPRNGGERGCIRARGRWCGYPVEMVLGSTDYSAGELCTLSQLTYWLFKYSQMRDAINRSGDPGILHSELAAEVLGVSLEEFLVRLKSKDKTAVDFRQASKPENFGKPAGMGSPKIVATNRKKSAGFTVCEHGPAHNEKGEPGYWGIRFCVLIGGAKQCGVEKITEWKGFPCAPVCKKCVEIEANVLSPAYFRRFPEIKDYHKWAGQQVERKQPAPCVVWDPDAGRPRIVRLRGGCDFPAYCNNGFQGMLADIGKDAYCELTRECFLGVKRDGSPSPLAGCRLPLFMHDEPVSELILATAHLSGPRIAEVMVASGKKIAPDVTWKAETALAFWLSKKMEPAYAEKDGQKKLVPWGPVPEYLKSDYAQAA